MLPLLVAPDSTFLRIELAVVIGVDLIEPLAVELVTFPGRHRRQLVVMDLAPLKARLVGCGKASGGQLPGEPRLALLQIARSKVAVLVKGDHVGGGGRLEDPLRGCRPVLPRHRRQNGSRSKEGPSSHHRLLGNWFASWNKT